ncbi:hypothetical protein COCMIDRAFT_32672 [Bipolaris oryzae ATCC 44560]|uniref:Uncharacterized protein n=1 Tax=Bipolaris oryzae ATCC 44560 TaxID=930090 RepID=W7A262_COCMI|nr:uncharacterized protein COCMIDRAFT_32672 [Bipolaris oryzae ATCC 44560]EUC50111.1 hypothetical protein COCMIDRAFT_32672 [Bipolaris oryzae ATCC 44560]
MNNDKVGNPTSRQDKPSACDCDNVRPLMKEAEGGQVHHSAIIPHILSDASLVASSHLYQTERTPRIPGRICCGCDKLFATASFPALCMNCGHATCEACPVIEFVPRGHNLSSHQNTNEGPGNSLEKILQALSEPDRSRGVDRNNGQEIRGQVQHEGDREQENQVKPRREHPKEQQQSSSISGRKERKLNMDKCQRCRDDKKKGKCNRCIEKGLPCSERTRVIRPRKLASKSPPPTHNDISPPIVSDALKISFDQIALLVSYYKMMDAARKRLNELQKSMKPFLEWNLLYDDYDSGSSFYDFVNAISFEAIPLCLKILLTEQQFLNSPSIRSLFISLILTVDSHITIGICPFCDYSGVEIPINGLIDSMDLCRNFVLKEHVLQCHGDEFNKDELEEEIQMYTKLSLEVPQKIGMVLEALGFSNLAEQSRSIGLFRDDWVIWLDRRIPISQSGGLDCLRRTEFHRILDYSFKEDQELSHILGQAEHLQNDVSVWNSQDILGRTPLHILCQFEENDTAIELLQGALEAGANSGIATIHGTIPLHHAAANGSVDMCNILVKHGGKSDMEVEQCSKRTALGLAVVNKQDKVVDLLKDYYTHAGMKGEVARADRIAVAVREGKYKRWISYSE